MNAAALSDVRPVAIVGAGSVLTTMFVLYPTVGRDALLIVRILLLYALSAR